MCVFFVFYAIFVQVGDGTLSFSFSGQLNDKMKGFYRSKYTSLEGEERFGACTQFEVCHVNDIVSYCHSFINLRILLTHLQLYFHN